MFDGTIAILNSAFSLRDTFTVHIKSCRIVSGNLNFFEICVGNRLY